MRVMDACFHAAGITECSQQKLKRLYKAGSRAGHLLNTLYELPSNGEGAEVLHAFLTAVTSSMDMFAVSNSAVGGLGEGIYSG